MNARELSEYEERELQIVADVNRRNKAPSITDFYEELVLSLPTLAT